MSDAGVFDVPPEDLLSVASAFQAGIDSATALVAQWKSTHENTCQPGSWHGDAAVANMQTTIQIDSDLRQMIEDGSFLANALNKIAEASIAHESDMSAMARGVLGGTGGAATGDTAASPIEL